MITLDYNAILNAQYHERKRRYKSLFSLYFLFRRFFSTNWLKNRINKKLTSQLLGVKGTYAYLVENVEELKGKNLRLEIEEVEDTIKQLYETQDVVEQRLGNPEYPELKVTHGIISEIIEVMHDTLRLLKKNTLKTPLAQPSEEAKIAVGHSAKTVNKILYGR